MAEADPTRPPLRHYPEGQPRVGSRMSGVDAAQVAADIAGRLELTLSGHPDARSEEAFARHPNLVIDLLLLTS